MKENVIQAIRERRLLQIRYQDDRQMIVAPQVLGETMTGYLGLFCWHDERGEDAATGWRLLDVGEITGVRLLPRHFGALPSHRGLPGREFKTFEAVV